MSKLLIDDYPIQVLPKLAKEIGLNEAIFLQQLHYWLNGKNAKTEEGRKWVYNTYESWQKQFPFWSVRTIKRIVSSLYQQKLIIKNNFNKAGFDKTIWYSIDYDALKLVERSSCQNGTSKMTNCHTTKCQNDTSKMTNCHTTKCRNDTTNTIDYTETTTETNKHKAKTPARHKYGEYKNVLLTDEQLEKLKKEFPTDYQERIERVSIYCESSGKTYKNYLATIRNWAKKDKEQRSAKKLKNERDYDEYGDLGW